MSAVATSFALVASRGDWLSALSACAVTHKKRHPLWSAVRVSRDDEGRTTLTSGCDLGSCQIVLPGIDVDCLAGGFAADLDMLTATVRNAAAGRSKAAMALPVTLEVRDHSVVAWCEGRVVGSVPTMDVAPSFPAVGELDGEVATASLTRAVGASVYASDLAQSDSRMPFHCVCVISGPERLELMATNRYQAAWTECEATTELSERDCFVSAAVLGQAVKHFSAERTWFSVPVEGPMVLRCGRVTYVMDPPTVASRFPRMVHLFDTHGSVWVDVNAAAFTAAATFARKAIAASSEREDPVSLVINTSGSMRVVAGVDRDGTPAPWLDVDLDDATEVDLVTGFDHDTNTLTIRFDPVYLESTLAHLDVATVRLHLRDARQRVVLDDAEMRTPHRAVVTVRR